MGKNNLTNYDNEAEKFSRFPEYSIHCGTDYLAVKDIPGKIKVLKSVNKILDLGCGSGLATRYLKEHFPDVFIMGADINKKMLEQAAIADPAGLYLYLQQLHDQIFYPFLSNFFDVVICSFVLHENQTMRELKIFLENISKIIRPGGTFLAWDTHKNLSYGKWLSIESVSTNLIEEGERYSVRILPANAKITGTYWSPETLAHILESFGFESNITYPIIEKNDDINWIDETRLAPYFLLESIKTVL